MVSDYERQRAINVEKVCGNTYLASVESDASALKNKELLESLGLDKPLFEPKAKQRKAKTGNRKRKAPPEINESSSEPAKVLRTSSESEVLDTSVRRSSRNAGKKIDYNAEQPQRPPFPLLYSGGVKTMENTGPLGREDGMRKYDP